MTSVVAKSKSTLNELETQLAQLIAERDSCEESAAKNFSKELLANHAQLTHLIMTVRRAIAKIRGWPYVVPLNWDAPWTTSSDFIVYHGNRGFAAFAYDQLRSQSKATDTVAVVQLRGVYAIRSGGPNDEVRENHPLCAGGLGHYGAYLVIRSEWIAAEQAINRKHQQFIPEHWRNLRHYIWLFLDGQIEAIASDVTVKKHPIDLNEWRPSGDTFANE